MIFFYTKVVLICMTIKEKNMNLFVIYICYVSPEQSIAFVYLLSVRPGLV